MSPRAIVALTLVFASGLTVHAFRVQSALSDAPDPHQIEYVGSGACTRCHPGHAESFGRTFHRTMTQDVATADRLAPFDGGRLRYGGYEARFTTEGDARLVTLTGADSEARRFEVERTVGSHRYQQFLARADDDTWIRLPVGYHMEEERFFHMNEAFLTADPEGLAEGAPVSLADFDRHVVPWNDNCVFCHNVAPSPGFDAREGRFDTHVAELGVACEACHGPGAEHIARNSSPVRRYLLHASETPDRSIVNPARLSPERSADACGRCHGQRITDDIGSFLAHGDPFVPGEDLALYSAPLFADTTLNGEPVFGARFWEDGTPRLTAYEYQGLLQSRCASEGGLTCTSCHGMHDGDPDGQIRPELVARAGEGMCIGCHVDERTEHPSIAAHPTASCISCHMPEVVYGVRGVRISHRIDIPVVSALEAGVRPDACVLCHGDMDAERHRVSPEDAALFTLLFGGDPLQRSVAASALRGPVIGVEEPVIRGWLLEVMRGDPYPAIRAIGYRSLRARHPSGSLEGYVPTDSLADRERAIAGWSLPITPPSAARMLELVPRRSAAAIDIGE
jgi:predicted CXXCH cytochrome family protein